MCDALCGERVEDLNEWAYGPEAVEPEVEREEGALYWLAPASDWDPLKLELGGRLRGLAMEARSPD